MKEIKTRPGLPEPRILDRVALIPQSAKNAAVRLKDGYGDRQEHSSPEQYAIDKATHGAERATHQALNQGRNVVKKTGETIKRGRNAARNVKKAADTSRKGVKAASKTVKAAGKGVKTSAQAAKASAKTAKMAADTARRAVAVAIRAMKASIKLMIQLIKLTIKAVIAAVKAAIAAVKGLVAAIAAGGWIVLVVVIAIGIVAFLILSPFGILTGGGADNTPTVSDMIITLNSELTDTISNIQKDAGQVDKVTISFNGNEDNGFIDNWPDILAVYAVKTDMDPQNPMDVVVMDNQRVSQLRDVFWDMNTVISHISESAPTPSPTASLSPDATATAEPYRVLTISVSSRYWDDMIGEYSFNDDQAKMLSEMMSAKNVVLLMQLVDSAMGKPATDWSSIIDVPEGGMDIPLYLQGDYRQTVCYIDGEAKSVATSGCGATSVSMVIAYLTGNTAQTPYTLFKWAYEHGYYSGDGLGHSCLTQLAGLYGVKGTWIENDASIITAALQAGYPVVAHMGPGIFTSSGHYIVLRGITADGYVLVNDPGSRKRNRYAYKLSTVVAQARTSSSFMVCEVEK